MRRMAAFALVIGLVAVSAYSSGRAYGTVGDDQAGVLQEKGERYV